MIDNFTDLLDAFILSITFSCHAVIFSSIFYTVINNHTLPMWQRTSLWYIGVSSAFVSFTIILQWLFGAKFPMSYDRMGILGEVLLIASMASGAIAMFITCKKHVEEKRKAKILAEQKEEQKKKMQLIRRPPTTNKLKPMRPKKVT